MFDGAFVTKEVTGGYNKPPPPRDKKSQTWSETLGISYPGRHGPGVQWNGWGSIWKAVGSSWNGLGFNWNGLESPVKGLNQERAVLHFLFVLF